MQKGYFIGFGSNVDPEENVEKVLLNLRERFGTLCLSRIVETVPTAGLQGRFLNAVIYLQSALDSSQMKAELCRIETTLGRDRTDPNRAMRDRTADLDILLELAQTASHIATENITQEPYYRPSMLELAKSMGLSCESRAEPVWNATEVSLADARIGLKPACLLTGKGPGLVQERRAALVTGAAVRLGNAIAIMLAKLGYDIALHYNSSGEEAEGAAEVIRKLGVRCELFKHDLKECPGIAVLVRDVLDRFPHIDLLVNSASVYSKGKIAETTPEMLEQQWAVNFKAPFFLIKEFARAVERGSIINLIDNKIAFNQYHYAAYLGSKKALAELTKMAALEFAPRIRVNGVAPGVVLPPADREQSYLEWRRETIPTKTLGSPAQICEAVNMLLANEFMNGQILFVDGGEAMNFVGRNFDSYGTAASKSSTRMPIAAINDLTPQAA